LSEKLFVRNLIFLSETEFRKIGSCSNGAPMHTRMKSFVSGDNGAPPENMSRTRPPSMFRIFL
jgi:hypothetical protein